MEYCEYSGKHSITLLVSLTINYVDKLNICTYRFYATTNQPVRDPRVVDWITSLLFVVARCLVRDMIKYRWRRRRSGWSGSSPVHVHLLDFCACASGHNNGVHGIQSVSWHVTIWSHSARLGRFVPSTATDATYRPEGFQLQQVRGIAGTELIL